ncbi:MAG: transcriptional regulator, LysR family [Bacteriovoracaceae bacterium]|nr:transcriptional regulator, LysR family [Bacteriovoracaceae bacterium]
MSEIYHSRIQYFLKLAKHPSFSTASTQCGISQSALSSAIQKLEDDLGTKLFDRSKKGVKLTSRGQALYSTLSKTETMLNQEISKDLSFNTRTIKVGAPHHVARNYLFPLLKKKSEKFSQTFQFLMSRSFDLLKAVEDDQLDFAFVSWTNRPTGVDWIDIKRDEISIVGHREQFSKIRKAKKLSDLDNEPWVYYPKPQYDWHESLVPGKKAFVVRDAMSLKVVLLSGMAIGEAQLDFFTKEERSLLVKAPIRTLHPDVRLYAIYKKDLASDIKETLQFLVGEMKLVSDE